MMHFIDFEVFKYDWLCVIINPITKTKTIIDNKKDLKKYYDKFKGEIFIGHNIKGYDQWIFKGILTDNDPKVINDKIIMEDRKGFEISTDLNKYPLIMYDTKEISGESLKTIECFTGANIFESKIDFNLDRKLTKEEKEETIKYCTYDVEQTINLFMIGENKRKEFSSIFEIVKMFNLPLTNINRSKAQLSAIVLGANPKIFNDEFQYLIIEDKIKKYTQVIDFFKNAYINNYNLCDQAVKQAEEDLQHEKNKNKIKKYISTIENNKRPNINARFYDRNLEIMIANVPHVVAWGGLHGARPKYQGEGYFVNIDVISYYPSLMIEYNLISRAVTNAKKFKEIYDRRVEFKKNKDPRQAPLKIVLNSTYGAMKDINNKLYDPQMANSVCVTGQILLIALIEKLEPYFDIIQSNTDGILIKLRANDEKQANEQYKLLDGLCYQWEQDSKMKLEFEEFNKVYQKDVNNYIIIKKNGEYKCKGKYVKKLNELDYNLPIVNKSIVNYLTKEIPIEQTINNCNDLIEFQNVYKLTSNYNYILHNNKKYTNKTYRVYASKNKKDTTLYKVKDGKNPEKFADAPDHCFIYNDVVKNKEILKNIDKNYYIELAKKRLSQFFE